LLGLFFVFLFLVVFILFVVVVFFILVIGGLGEFKHG
jgi:hypothetical protein